jgi:hypothetical protein
MRTLTSRVRTAESLAEIEQTFSTSMPSWHSWATTRVRQTIEGEMRKYADRSIDIVTSVDLLSRAGQECGYLLKYHSDTTATEMCGVMVRLMWFIVQNDVHLNPNPGYVGGAHEHNLYRRFVSTPQAWGPVLYWWNQALDDEDVVEIFQRAAANLRVLWASVSERHQDSSPEESEYRFKAQFGSLIHKILSKSDATPAHLPL